MALEKTFREFTTQLRRVHDRLEELRVTVVEDKPRANDAVIVDRFEYAVEDLFGAVDEISAAAGEAQRAVGYPLDIEQARQALTRCQEQFHKFEQGFNAHLVSYERIKDLTTFGTERRGEWPSWVASVKQGIEQCREPVEAAGRCLAECWAELAERVGTMSVAINSTNIGQKIIRPLKEEMLHE
jgi:multidrug resistance efflux pump